MEYLSPPHLLLQLPAQLRSPAGAPPHAAQQSPARLRLPQRPLVLVREQPLLLGSLRRHLPLLLLDRALLLLLLEGSECGRFSPQFRPLLGAV